MSIVPRFEYLPLRGGGEPPVDTMPADGYVSQPIRTLLTAHRRLAGTSASEPCTL